MAEDQASGGQLEAEFTAEVALPQAEGGPCLKIRVALPLEGPERGRQGNRKSVGHFPPSSPSKICSVLRELVSKFHGADRLDLTVWGAGQLELSYWGK